MGFEWRMGVGVRRRAGQAKSQTSLRKQKCSTQTLSESLGCAVEMASELSDQESAHTPPSTRI